MFEKMRSTVLRYKSVSKTRFQLGNEMFRGALYNERAASQGAEAPGPSGFSISLKGFRTAFMLEFHYGM